MENKGKLILTDTVHNFTRTINKNKIVSLYKFENYNMLNNNIVSCEIRSLTLREERSLRVFENRIQRRIFGPTRDANGEWRRLHNE